MSEDRAVEQWEQWHVERNQKLREPHGWLSLINLEWVGDQPGELQSFPGVWSADDHTVTATFTESDRVTQNGEPVTGTVVMQIPRGESNTSLEALSGLQAEVASRFGKIVVRTRDPQAPTRQDFLETQLFDYSSQWVVQGPWAPFADPVTVPIPSAYEGRPMTLTGQGVVELFGTDLTVTGSDPEHLQLIFFDPTNGEETEAWRSAPVTILGDIATVDFNRAVNFPAHFTPFGTCPTPPAGNTLSVPVRAGERKNL